MFTCSNVRRALIGVAVLASAGAALAQDAVTLKYKWNKGDVLHYRSVQDTTGKMAAMGMERKTSQKQEFVHRLEVKEVGDDGAATLDMVVVSVKASMDQGTGTPGEYDSSKSGEELYVGPPQLRPMMETMGMLVGEHTTMVVDGMGSVRKVEGMNKVVEKMLAKMGSANPIVARNLRNTMGDEAVRGNMEQFFKVLPEKAVKPGDTWSSTFEQSSPGMGGRMKVDSDWTFAGPEALNGTAGVKMTSVMKIDVAPAKEGEETGLAPGMKMTVTDGKGSGESYFDPKAGQLLKAVVNMNLPIEISMSAQGQNMAMKNETASKFTFERIPAPAAVPAPAPAPGEKKGDEPKSVGS